MPNNVQPLGIEFVRRGVATQDDIAKAIEYQTDHPDKKIGDILYELRLADPEKMLNAMADIFNEKTIFLTRDKIKVKVDDYISMDVAKEDLAIPFEIKDGVIKVCFANIANNFQIESIRLLMLNKGLIMKDTLLLKILLLIYLMK